MFNKLLRFILALSVSCSSFFSIKQIFNITISENNFINILMYIVIILLSLFLNYKMFENIKKREIKYSIIFSLFLSLILLFGQQIELYEKTSITIEFCFRLLFLIIFFTPFLYFLFCKINKINNLNIRDVIKWSKVKIFIIIAGIWFLSYLALYPGIYDYDSIAQTSQFLVTHQFSSHHPIIHSFILSGFLYIGNAFFNSYQLGLGIYSLFQMLCLAYVATEITWFIRKRNHTILFYLALIFFMFFPLHYIMSVWATKDILFTSFFSLFSIEIIKIIEEKEQYFNSNKNVFKYIVLLILVCMFRNNGICAIVIMLPIGVIFIKQIRKKMIIFTMLGIGIYLSYQNVLLPNLGVVPGNIREMLSIPCQQLAKVYTEKTNVFSEEEKQLLFEVIPESQLKYYKETSMISDTIKNFLDSDRLKQETSKYLKLYINIGLREPHKYIDAFLTNSLGFWYPNKLYPDVRMFHPYVEFDMADPELFKGEYIYIERSSKLPVYETFLRIFILDSGWKYTPILFVLYIPGFYFVLLCLMLMILIYKRNWEKLVIIGFWLGFWLTLLLGPVALVRYAYPIIFCLPLLIYSILDNNVNKRV